MAGSNAAKHAARGRGCFCCTHWSQDPQRVLEILAKHKATMTVNGQKQLGVCDNHSSTTGVELSYATAICDDFNAVFSRLPVRNRGTT